MTITIAIASSTLVGIVAWAVWPLLRNDMDRSLDMTALSIASLAGMLFVGGATTLAALS